MHGTRCTVGGVPPGHDVTADAAGKLRMRLPGRTPGPDHHMHGPVRVESEHHLFGVRGQQRAERTDPLVCLIEGRIDEEALPDLEDVARLAVTNNWGLLELKSISMTLEDVFLKLTRHEEGVAQPAAEAADRVVVTEDKTESPS